MAWFSGQKITAVWVNGWGSNGAWVYVPGMGWQALRPQEAGIREAMVSQAVHAKSDNRFVDFDSVNGDIRTLVVW